MAAASLAKEAEKPVSVLKSSKAVKCSDGRIRYKRRPASGHSVSFTPETHTGMEADLALSITRHRIKDGKYVEYTIVVHQKGYQIFPIQKRYKQFEALHANMKKEDKDYELPHLPKKRWFKTNKWDDDYHIDRRFALQLYLRLMVKFYAKSSPVLRDFLELKEDLPDDDDVNQAVPESQRHLLDKMESMNAQILQNLPSLARKVDADAAAVLEGVTLPPPASSYHVEGQTGDISLPAPPREATPEPSKDSSITGDPWAEGSTPSSPLGSPKLMGSGGSATATGEKEEGGATAWEEEEEEEEEEEVEQQWRASMTSSMTSEGDYMQDSIASSTRVQQKRIEGGGAPDDENRVAAQLNHTLLQHAKSSESLAGRDRGSERARSVEFLSGADNGGDPNDNEEFSSLFLAKALAKRSQSVDSIAAAAVSTRLKADAEAGEEEEEGDYDFDV